MYLKRRVLALILLITLTVSLLPVNVRATQNAQPKDEQAVEEVIRKEFGELLELYNLDQEEPLTADSVTILKPVEFYVKDEDDCEQGLSLHLPVMDDTDTIRCIFDIIFSDGGYCATIGADFAPLLNEAFRRFGRNVTLLQDEFELYAAADAGCLRQCGRQIEVLDKEEEESLREAFSAALSPQMASASTDMPTESSIRTSFEVHSSYTDIARESIQSVALQDLLQETAVIYTNNLKNYPITNQRINGKECGCCWAATIASILQFEKPGQYSSITAKTICDEMGVGYNEGATNSKAKKTLAHYLPSNYVPTTYSRALIWPEIKTVIDNVDPAYLGCTRHYGFLNLGTKGHAVALCGYSFSSSEIKVKIMDPAYEKYKWCTLKDGKWTFDFGKYHYTWTDTIRLLYKA